MNVVRAIRDILITVMAVAVTVVCLLIIITWSRLATAASGSTPDTTPGPDPTDTVCVGDYPPPGC